MIDRAAGLDVHKDTVRAAVRVPDETGGRSQTVKEFRTFTGELFRLRDWLVERGVTLVVMEATGVYWKLPWHVLEGTPGMELMSVNAHHVRNLPGRKDVSDAAWLAQLAECGLWRGSFVPPPVIAQLRDLTRHRKKLSNARLRRAPVGVPRPKGGWYFNARLGRDPLTGNAAQTTKRGFSSASSASKAG